MAEDAPWRGDFRGPVSPFYRGPPCVSADAGRDYDVVSNFSSLTRFYPMAVKVNYQPTRSYSRWRVVRIAHSAACLGPAKHLFDALAKTRVPVLIPGYIGL
jgi:hypothetical protein